MSSDLDNMGSHSDVDRLIHEPARLLLMTVLSVVASADFVYLAGQTGLSGGNLSTHLTKLEDAGYISAKKSFVNKRPRTVLKITASGKRAFEAYRSQISLILSYGK